MGKKSAPAPDYTGAAKEQAAASKENTTDQTWANRPDQNTPWGKSSWGAAAQTDPVTGKPVTKWTQTETLNPELQKALQDQLNIQSGRSELAGGMMDRVKKEYGQEFDWSGLPEVPGTAEAAQQTAYERMGELQAPERARARENQKLALLNTGFTENSEGWNRESQRLSDAESRQSLQNLLASGAEGRAQGAYQQGVRSSAIGEQQQRRGMSLNELNAVLTGQQVQQPQMPSFMGAGRSETPDLLGAMGGTYNAQADQAAQSSAQTGQAIGSIAGIAGMIAL
jgi:hypothetical protein